MSEVTPLRKRGVTCSLLSDIYGKLIPAFCSVTRKHPSPSFANSAQSFDCRELTRGIGLAAAELISSCQLIVHVRFLGAGFRRSLKISNRFAGTALRQQCFAVF